MLGSIILICGIIMTLTDQVGAGKSGGYHKIGQYRIPSTGHPEITGPGAIGLGSIIVIFILIAWYKENKKNRPL